MIVTSWQTVASADCPDSQTQWTLDEEEINYFPPLSSPGFIKLEINFYCDIIVTTA